MWILERSLQSQTRPLRLETTGSQLTVFLDSSSRLTQMAFEGKLIEFLSHCQKFYAVSNILHHLKKFLFWIKLHEKFKPSSANNKIPQGYSGNAIGALNGLYIPRKLPAKICCRALAYCIFQSVKLKLVAILPSLCRNIILKIFLHSSTDFRLTCLSYPESASRGLFALFAFFYSTKTTLFQAISSQCQTNFIRLMWVLRCKQAVFSSCQGVIC